MKLFILQITIFLLFVSVNSFSQELDSLELPYQHLPAEAKLEMFLKLAEESQTKNVIISIRYARKSLALAQQLKREFETGMANKLLGKLYYLEADYARGYEYLLNAINIFQNLGDTVNLVQVRITIGDILDDLKRYEEARKYYFETIGLTKDPDVLAVLYTNIGNTLLSEGNYDDAYNHYLKTLEYKPLVKNQRSISDAYTGLAILYEDKGEYQEAIKYYQMGLEVEKLEDDKVAMTSSYLNIGDLLRKMKKFDRASEMILGGVQLARENNLKFEVLYGYNMLGTLYFDKGDFKSAYSWRTKAMLLKDSIFTSELADKLAEAKVLYEIDLKDSRIKILEKENTALFWQRTFYLTTLVLAVSIIVVSYIFYRKKVKLADELAKVNTQLEEKNQKLTISESSLRKLVFAKDKYISILAHDLRGPFQGLMGLIDVLNKDFGTMRQSEIKEFLQLIESSIRNLFDLLDNLLEWSKMRTGSVQVERSQISLNSVIDEIVAIYQSNAMQKNIVLIADLQNDIVISASEHMLKSIIRNLVSNAIKFTSQGGYVRIKASRIDGTVEIRVSDTGIGISQENIVKIFSNDRFSTEGTEMEKGSGLGLILTKEFVELHNGTITVSSQEGKGTEFVIALPLK